MFAARRLLTQPCWRIAAQRVAIRQIHSTPRRFAVPPNPDLDAMLKDPQVRETFEKLSRHPPALIAMQKVAEIVQKNGFEPGKPPSKLDMLKLMMNSEFREAAEALGKEMQAAGVDLNAETFSKLMNPPEIK